jgi:hypothetical protein
LYATITMKQLLYSSSKQHQTSIKGSLNTSRSEEESSKLKQDDSRGHQVKGVHL